MMQALMDEVDHEPGATGGTVAILRRRMGGDETARTTHP
jgi:hypothetical protein